MWWLFACMPPSPVASAPVGSAEAPPPGSSTGSSTEGGQSGEDPSYGTCGDTVVIGGPDDVVVGVYGPFTAADLVALAEGVHEQVLTWDDGSTADLIADVVWDGEIRLVDTASTGSTSSCEPRIEIDGTGSFTTSDGQLAEGASMVLEGSRATAAGFVAGWDHTTLVGTFVFPEGTSTLGLTAWTEGEGLHGFVTVEDATVATF